MPHVRAFESLGISEAWVYTMAFGTFTITVKSGKTVLQCHEPDIMIGEFPDPASAALAAAQHRTGNPSVDRRYYEVPETLEEWTQILPVAKLRRAIADAQRGLRARRNEKLAAARMPLPVAEKA